MSLATTFPPPLYVRAIYHSSVTLPTLQLPPANLILLLGMPFSRPPFRPFPPFMQSNRWLLIELSHPRFFPARKSGEGINRGFNDLYICAALKKLRGSFIREMKIPGIYRPAFCRRWKRPGKTGFPGFIFAFQYTRIVFLIHLKKLREQSVTKMAVFRGNCDAKF